MNDFDPLLDEIVSAYVDGAATPAERARVESDPALVERAETFRRLHAEVAAPVAPAADAVRQSLISRALGQADLPPATVHEIRRRRYTAVGPIATAAVIIAVFFGLGTWLVASQDNNDSSSSTAAASATRASDNFDTAKQSASAAATAGASASGAVLAPSTPGAEANSARPAFLGAFADETALRQALASVPVPTVATPATTETLPPQTTACPRSDLAGATTYVAQLRGRPVTVYAAGTRAEVVDNATCQRTLLDLSSR